VVDLDTIADELYALPLKEFTAARSSHEKAAKAAGNKDLAAAIHALAKPTAAAWLANQLVRTYPDEIKPLLQLGAGLREATATLQGEQLRELGRQQYKLIAALVHQARRLGDTVSADTARALESTLRAALADESVAEQLSAGRLTEALERTGFPPPAGSSPPIRARSPVKVATPERPATAADKRRAAELERAEHVEQQAKFAAHKATDAHERARAEAADADEALAEAASETEQLRRDLDQAITEQARLERQAGSLSAALKKAERTKAQADQELEDATKRRRELANRT
jgi:hypothetical protein